MKYPALPDFKQLSDQMMFYTQLKAEYGAKNIAPILKDAEKSLKTSLKKLKKLPVDKKLAAREPNKLKAIQAQRKKGIHRFWDTLDKKTYEERLEGALLGRFAGCTLGAPVEFWPIKKMKALAEENGDTFPPEDYWSYVPEPASKRYQMSRRDEYIRDNLAGVPVDDDIVYTLLGLLIVEKFGPDFTLEDVGKAWVEYLPYACTAEKIALDNLKKGIPASRAGSADNPFCEWIGADIRSDPWGYMAPGWPEKAAEMAYRDACISHRRQGIYGEMYFAAAIAAAFALDDPVKALHAGLCEIPRHSALAHAVRWALRVAPEIKNYKQARSAADSKFEGMHRIHTINNACLTVWGITIGGTDFTKVIGETVAMGLDNDCTAATAGSIAGAVVGKKGIPRKWYKGFNNTVRSYLTGKKTFTISGLVRRFSRQAARVFSSSSTH